MVLPRNQFLCSNLHMRPQLQPGDVGASQVAAVFHAATLPVLDLTVRTRRELAVSSTHPLPRCPPHPVPPCVCCGLCPPCLLCGRPLRLSAHYSNYNVKRSASASPRMYCAFLSSSVMKPLSSKFSAKVTGRFYMLVFMCIVMSTFCSSCSEGRPVWSPS